MSEPAVVKIGSNDLFGDFDYFSEGAYFLILCNLSLRLHRQDKHQYPLPLNSERGFPVFSADPRNACRVRIGP